MILKREGSEVAVLGEVEKFKVSIDEKNINHIVTILSSNLYSHPLDSFMREIVSNAVDSHIEAGTKEPIIITVTETNISIRDYGTGISPERFREIFINIGSSTKRESNEYIGSFGLGRFSALSISDVVNITSFYNGKAYYYVMNKDIDQLHIDLLFEKDTDEANGVEVKVPYRNAGATLNCLHHLAFVENIYVNLPFSPEEGEVFNTRKIFKGKTFKKLNYTGFFRGDDRAYTQVLIGSIPYRVDYHEIGLNKDWEFTFKYILPCLEIGEVDITPNREALLYSERTKKALLSAYNRCIEELTQLWEQQTAEEIEDFAKYIECIAESYVNELTLSDGTVLRLSSTLPKDRCYKGKDWWKSIPYDIKRNTFNSLLYYQTDILSSLYDNTLSKSAKHHVSVKEMLRQFSSGTMVISMPSLAGTSGIYFKPYIREKYTKGDVIFIRNLPPVTHTALKRFAVELWGVNILTSKNVEVKFRIEVLTEFIRWVNANIVKADIIGNPEYEKYKKDNAEPRTKSKDYTGTIPLTIYASTMYNRHTKKNVTVQTCIQWIKSTYPKYRIVYATVDNPFVEALMRMMYKNLVIICAAKNNFKKLESALPAYIRPIEELYSEDNRQLQKAATANYILNTFKPKFSSTFEHMYPKPIQEKLKILKEIINGYTQDTSYSSKTDVDSILSCIPVEKYDRKILALWNETKKYAMLTGSLIKNYFQSNTKLAYILTHYKVIRLDYNTYKSAYDSYKNDVSNILKLMKNESNQM